MMTCRQLVELLIDYVSDDLPAELRQHVEQHLRCCPPCLTYAETYRCTIRLSRCLSCKPPPLELFKRVESAMQAELGRPVQQPRQAPPPPAG
jgi:anti-sigma factor RsiW